MREPLSQSRSLPRSDAREIAAAKKRRDKSRSTATTVATGGIGPTKEYSPLGSLIPTGWVPSLLIVPNGVQFGAMIPGFDISQKHVYNIFGGYDTRGLPFADIDYSYRFAKTLAADATAYFLPSYIISSRSFFKSWGSSVGLGTNIDFGLGRQDTRVRLSAVFRRLEPYKSLAANQSVGAGLDISQSWNLRRKPLSISAVSGTRLSVSHQQYFKVAGSNDNYFSTTVSGDQYIEAPWAEDHVVYLASRLGTTQGTTLINNYFQGGGELIFSQGRGFFLNRGFFPELFWERRMVSASFEYRFPIANIERGYRMYPAFLRRLHAALVADTMSEDINPLGTSTKDFFKVFYGSAGVELKSDWIFSYYLPAAFRIGAYHGFGIYGEPVYVTFALEAGL